MLTCNNLDSSVSSVCYGQAESVMHRSGMRLVSEAITLSQVQAKHPGYLCWQGSQTNLYYAILKKHPKGVRSRDVLIWAETPAELDRLLSEAETGDAESDREHWHAAR